MSSMKMSKLPKLTLEKARALYAKTGFCKHDYPTTFEIPGCNIEVTQCKVCAHEIDRHYTNDIGGGEPNE